MSGLIRNASLMLTSILQSSPGGVFGAHQPIPLFVFSIARTMGRLFAWAKRGSLGCIGDTNPVRFWHHTLIECSKHREPVGEHPPVHAVESRRTEVQSIDLIGVMGRRDLGTRKDGRAWAGDHARELIPFGSDSGSMHGCSS